MFGAGDRPNITVASSNIVRMKASNDQESPKADPYTSLQLVHEAVHVLGPTHSWATVLEEDSQNTSAINI